MNIVKETEPVKDIKETRDFLKKLLESANDLIYALDVNGNYTYLNPRIEDYGYTVDELLGRHFLTILTEKHRGRRFEKCIQEKARQIYEIEFKTKDGALRICRVSTSPLLDRDGNAVGLLGTLRDITEREHIRAELRYLKEYNERIVESIPSSLLVLDKNLIIKSVNRTYRDIRGENKEEVAGKIIKEVFPEHLLNEGGLLKAFDYVVETKESCRLYNVRHTSPHHPEKILNITVSSLEGGEESAFILIIEEITERAKLEAELRKKNEELENFVHFVSHDLKSPIVSLQGFSSILLKDYQDKLGKEGKRYLERIMANARHMENLVSDLLTLSKIGRPSRALKEFPCINLIKEVCSNLQPLLEKSGIEIVIGNNFPSIYADRERIYQVFINLLTNAIKFIGDTGSPRIEIGYVENEKFHQFYVRDNGIGIDVKYHQRIFEIFQRLKEVEDKEGTGVGLTIVERIVTNHGGNVWVESEKGKGATFYFNIP